MINLVAVRRKESCRGHGIFFTRTGGMTGLKPLPTSFCMTNSPAPAPKERRHFQVVKRLPLILAAVSISMRSCFFQARCGQAVQNQNAAFLQRFLRQHCHFHLFLQVRNQAPGWESAKVHAPMRFLIAPAPVPIF